MVMRMTPASHRSDNRAEKVDQGARFTGNIVGIENKGIAVPQLNWTDLPSTRRTFFMLVQHRGRRLRHVQGQGYPRLRFIGCRELSDVVLA